MAEEYGFQYEMVTYKWPSWLNKQTDKQRIIWAYKILFLDVLFPLDLKKVIYVDADQVCPPSLRKPPPSSGRTTRVMTSARPPQKANLAVERAELCDGRWTDCAHGYEATGGHGPQGGAAGVHPFL
jgi:hypothetical protein